MNKTVIYIMANNKVVAIVDVPPDLRTLDKSMDFMPLSVWNAGMELMGKPTIRLTEEA